MEKFNLIVITVIASIFVACSGEEATQNGGDEQVGKTVNIETVRLQPAKFQSKLRVVGNVDTKNDIMISAEVGGRILRHYVSEGDRVRNGQTILRINDAKLKQEKVRLESLTAQARENYERLKKIYEEDGIGSEMDHLNAKYNYEQNKSALESVLVDLDNTTITAPFNGAVESFALQPGEMASPGMQVVRLIGTDTFIISAGVPARYAGVIKNGDDVEIWFDTQSPDTLTGTITFVGNSIDPQNRTFRVEVLLPDQKMNYKVDMIANLRLNTLSEENVLIVSEEFIYKEHNDFVTYVLSENEQGQPVAERRIVKLGPSYRSDVIIREGLNFGDEFITLGSAFLNDGMRVNVVESLTDGLAVN